MATKKKTKKKSTSSKKSAGRKSPSRQPALKRRTPKKMAKRKAIPNKPSGKKKALATTSGGKTLVGTNKKKRKEGQPSSSSTFSRRSSGLQSGDLQGQSKVESVDSESVEELMEEGNAFEAEVVSGIEDSRNREGKEVRTRQVPEDDVPGEYLDED